MKTKKLVNINGKDYNLHRSIYTSNYSPVIVSDSMSGKMHDIPSISTSCLLNSHCQKYRQIKGSICEKCYAHATVKRYSGLNKNLESNYHILTEQILDASLLPKFSEDLTTLVRFESFGDIENETQVINYANIAKLSPNVTFALWTKNPAIAKSAFDKVGKPTNMVLIQSSLFINEEVQPANKHIDKTFTVFDKEGQKTNLVNCGSRDCFNCRKCYSKKTESKVYEALK